MIRKAEIKDIDRIAVLLEGIREVHHQIRPDLFKSKGLKYNKDEIKELINDESSPIFVYCENDIVYGYAFTKIIEHKNDNVLTDIKTLYIDDLCVDENKRGKNIGHMLYDYVINYAKEINCYNVTLNVWIGNDRAIKFYESLGLKPQKIGMETILK